MVDGGVASGHSTAGALSSGLASWKVVLPDVGFSAFGGCQECRRKHKPEEIVAKLRQVDVLVWQGRPGTKQAFNLSLAETRVAVLAAKVPVSETDEELQLSPNMVKTHLKVICQKTGAHSPWRPVD